MYRGRGSESSTCASLRAEGTVRSVGSNTDSRVQRKVELIFEESTFVCWDIASR